MPNRDSGTWVHGPTKSPAHDPGFSVIQRIRDEFYRCGGTVSDPITSQELARHLQQAAKDPDRNAADRPFLRSLDKQAIALRVSQLVREMDLRCTGSIDMDEWVHHMLLAQSRTPLLKGAKQINTLLRSALKQHRRILSDLLRMFEAADVDQGGCLSFRDVADMYSKRLWFLCPSSQGGIMSEAELDTRHPESLAQEVIEAMDLDNTNTISYAEFMAYCLGRRKQEVVLHLYDLSKGAAAALAPALRLWLGVQLDGLWHSGIVVYGKEYYFGGDIFYDAPAGTAFGTPKKRIVMGYTLWRQEELHNFIVDQLRPLFNREQYDVVYNNCNHFSDRLMIWLTGQHIPSEVIEQPARLNRTHVAKLVRPVLNRWLGNLDRDCTEPHNVFDSGRFCSLNSLTVSLLSPGAVVSISSADGEGLPVMGMLCNLRHPQRSRSAPPEAETPQGSSWVRYLDVTPGGGLLSSQATLRTESVPHARLTPVSLAHTNNVDLYLAALSAIMSPSAPSQDVESDAGDARCWGGASTGLQPILSLPPLSMFVDDEPPADSLVVTPKRCPDRETDVAAGQQRQSLPQEADAAAGAADESEYRGRSKGS